MELWAVIIFPHIGLVPVLPSFGSSNLQVTSLLTILAAVHLVTVVGLDVVKLGDVDGWDPGEAARQLRHRLAAELGDVLGAGVHLDEPLGHLLQGQRLAGLGAYRNTLPPLPSSRNFRPSPAFCC